MSKQKRTERGQVLILLTVGVITLLGFTALAIDGGRIYSERRNIQGISDTASMTGALYIAKTEGAITTAVKEQAKLAALHRAETNGYRSPEVVVDITQDGDYYYVETVIHTQIDPTIVQLVYDGPLKVAATSTTRVQKVDVFAVGQALFAINSSECRSIYFHGTADVTIGNTGIFANSDCTDNAIEFQGDAEADLDGNITSVGGVVVNKPENVDHGGILPGTQVNFTKIPPPSCAGLDPKSVSGSTLSPGVYNGMKFSGNGNWTLLPGLYCLDGDLSINNGTLTGEGVTFYMRSGSFRINGGTITLTAPSNENTWLDGAKKGWNGMLVFFGYDNYDDLIWNGNGDSFFAGTLYNYNGECQLNGTGNSLAYDAQVVCDTIDLIGNAELIIAYNPETKYLPPTVIDLIE